MPSALLAKLNLFAPRQILHIPKAPSVKTDLVSAPPPAAPGTPPPAPPMVPPPAGPETPLTPTPMAPPEASVAPAPVIPGTLAPADLAAPEVLANPASADSVGTYEELRIEDDQPTRTISELLASDWPKKTNISQRTLTSIRTAIDLIKKRVLPRGTTAEVKIGLVGDKKTNRGLLRISYTFNFANADKIKDALERLANVKSGEFGIMINGVIQNAPFEGLVAYELVTHPADQHITSTIWSSHIIRRGIITFLDSLRLPTRCSQRTVIINLYFAQQAVVAQNTPTTTRVS